MNFDLTEAQAALVECIDRLATERIAPRAAQYDRAYEPPLEDIKDLHAEGLLLATLERRYGGFGYGASGDDPLAFMLAIEHLARANPATAHCFQVHNHVIEMVSVFATDEQRERWLAPTIERAALLGGVGSEPRGAKPSLARRVPGGVKLKGMKNYATNASLGEWLVVANVAVEDEPAHRLRMMINTTWPGVTVDSSGWRPLGMRACISPAVHLDDCFVPDQNIIALSNDPRDRDWLGKFHVAFAANYLGTASGMLDWIVGYMRQHGTTDELRTLRLGELKTTLDATRLLVYQAGDHFRHDLNEAMLLGCEAKWMAKTALVQVMHTGAELAGSTALFEKYPLQRLYRDGQLHMLHNRVDVVACTVGLAELGLEYDINRER